MSRGTILPFPSLDKPKRACPEFEVGSAWGVRCLALVLLIALTPLAVVLIALIRVTSSGGAIYRQQRLGCGGVPYTMYKLRSMRQDAESATGAVWATRQDSRVTRIGRFLRWSHFDELPQLLNIIRGEMAFVGPRPERPEFVDDLAARLPGYRDRLAVLPGVTGLAQVNLPPDESIETVRQKLVFDRYYIDNATPGMDARILLATAFRLLGIRYNRGVRWLRIDPVSLPGFPSLELPVEVPALRKAA